MSKRSIGGDSSFTSHKRHAAAPQDESPLPSATSSLALQASSSSIPKIPLDLIADLILPFVADRATWNSMYCASKYLCLAGKKMTPPWPNTTPNFGQAVRLVVFSPSGSQLALVYNRVNTHQDVVHVWDRWGKEALLAGRTRVMHCLEYSWDGEYLASGCQDGSIRLWNTESFHAASSKISRGTPTQEPSQADTIMVGSGHNFVMTLSFSRTDSNILASGGSNGEIKLWNVKEQACIHSFDPRRGVIRALTFAGGVCMAVTNTRSIIRLWRAEGSSDFTSEIIGQAAPPGSAIFSPSGSFLATCIISYTEISSTLALYELGNMTKSQSVVMPGVQAMCFAVSPDSKQLVVGDYRGRIRLVQTDDFSIQRALDIRGTSSMSNAAVLSASFDPTCRVLAFGCSDGTVELRTL